MQPEMAVRARRAPGNDASCGIEQGHRPEVGPYQGTGRVHQAKESCLSLPAAAELNTSSHGLSVRVVEVTGN